MATTRLHNAGTSPPQKPETPVEEWENSHVNAQQFIDKIRIETPKEQAGRSQFINYVYRKLANQLSKRTIDNWLDIKRKNLEASNIKATDAFTIIEDALSDTVKMLNATQKTPPPTEHMKTILITASISAINASKTEIDDLQEYPASNTPNETEPPQNTGEPPQTLRGKHHKAKNTEPSTDITAPHNIAIILSGLTLQSPGESGGADGSRRSSDESAPHDYSTHDNSNHHD